ERAVAGVPAAAPVDPAPDRGIPLDAAPQAAVRGALFQPLPGARGAAARQLASPRPVRALPAGPDEPDHRPDPPSGDRQRADQSDDDHPRPRCVAEYVLDRHRAESSRGGQGRRGVVHRPPAPRHTDRRRRLRRVRGAGAAADDRPRGVGGCGQRVADRQPHGDRQRHLALDRRDRRGRSERRAEHARQFDRPQAAAGTEGDLRAGHHRPADRRGEQCRAAAGRRRAPGRRPGRAGLHDRLRHRARRGDAELQPRRSGPRAVFRRPAIRWRAGVPWGRLPARNRRGDAEAGRRAHRRQVLLGGERQRTRGRLQQPPDFLDHQDRDDRDQRRLRRTRRAAGRNRRDAVVAAAPAAV
ncbi:MAG: BatA (Bacteroides aerotolerance operon), partial [uncultured Thermomicrobiales bacterium]